VFCTKLVNNLRFYHPTTSGFNTVTNQCLLYYIDRATAQAKAAQIVYSAANWMWCDKL
jgi:hypothetical protein